MQKNDDAHFPLCSELLGEGKSIYFSAFSKKIGKIIDEFNRRFADFDLLKAKAEIFSNSMEIDIEPQTSYFQLELCEMQADPFLLSKKNERYESFWKFPIIEQFPRLGASVLKRSLASTSNFTIVDIALPLCSHMTFIGTLSCLHARIRVFFSSIIYFPGMSTLTQMKKFPVSIKLICLNVAIVEKMNLASYVHIYFAVAVYIHRVRSLSSKMLAIIMNL